MAKTPVCELRIMANQGRREIEIIHLADGVPVASIKFNQEQAESHARQVIEAIEIINAQRSSLIVPGSPKALHA